MDSWQCDLSTDRPNIAAANQTNLCHTEHNTAYSTKSCPPPLLEGKIRTTGRGNQKLSEPALFADLLADLLAPPRSRAALATAVLGEGAQVRGVLFSGGK